MDGMRLTPPLDGTAPLFRIGTRPLDPADWLEPDEHLGIQLAEKTRLLRERMAEVFAEEPGSRAAQTELFDRLAAYLPARFPELWTGEPGAIRIQPTGDRIVLDAGDPPLLTAALLVQDDLLLLQRDSEGWRLTAGSLCFPSSWVLAEKMGRVLDAIHAPVPDFGPGTRQAQIMARMFDALRPETPMIRWNFSLYGDDRLFHPDVSGPDQPRFGSGPRAGPVYLRVERQTLRKLPRSGAIAFSIRISIDPLERLERHPDGAEIAAGLADQIRALSPEQLAYKGLTREKERLLARLAERAP